MIARRLVVSTLAAASAALVCGSLYAQETPASDVTAPAATTAAPATQAPQVERAVLPVVPAAARSRKAEYTGPTSVIVLAPTPMLDEEGRQRVDPDGKLMWNAPVAQQRDKKGHPLFDEKGKPVFQTAKELGYDESGHRIHAEKEKPPKMIPVSISRGVMTVDGYTGKAALNYDIPDLKYIYLYAPGIGIAVVSNTAFPGATEQAGAFDDRTLTVTVNGHVLQVASDNRLLGKNPVSAFVRVDRDFTLPSKFPVMGYGNTSRAPYMWPGAKPNGVLAAAAYAPPVPRVLLPVQLLKPCPTGYMRPAGAALLPGEAPVEQPCVAIPKAAVLTMSASSKRSTGGGSARAGGAGSAAVGRKQRMRAR